MPYCNSTSMKVCNFSNEKYLDLLQEIIDFFESRSNLEFYWI